MAQVMDKPAAKHGTLTSLPPALAATALTPSTQRSRLSNPDPRLCKHAHINARTRRFIKRVEISVGGCSVSHIMATFNERANRLWGYTVYVYTYICIYIHIKTYTYTHRYVSLHIYIYIYTYACECVQLVYVRTAIHGHKCKHEYNYK